MITSYLRGMKPEEMALVTKLVYFWGVAFYKRMMGSILALLSVSDQWHIKMEVPRKQHSEFSHPEWGRALKESVKGEGRSWLRTHQKFQKRQKGRSQHRKLIKK